MQVRSHAILKQRQGSLFVLSTMWGHSKGAIMNERMAIILLPPGILDRISLLFQLKN